MLFFSFLSTSASFRIAMKYAMVQSENARQVAMMCSVIMANVATTQFCSLAIQSTTVCVNITLPHQIAQLQFLWLNTLTFILQSSRTSCGCKALCNESGTRHSLAPTSTRVFVQKHDITSACTQLSKWKHKQTRTYRSQPRKQLFGCDATKYTRIIPTRDGGGKRGVWKVASRNSAYSILAREGGGN